MPETKGGLRVQGFTAEDSPAARSGLMAGDVVYVAVDNNGNSAYDNYKIAFNVGLGVQSALRSIHQRTPNPVFVPV